MEILAERFKAIKVLADFNETGCDKSQLISAGSNPADLHHFHALWT